MANSNQDNLSGFSGSSGNGSYRGEAGKTASDAPNRDKGSERIDFKHVFYTIWSHKWKIIGSILLCTLLAGAIAYTVTPIYRSEGSLLISGSQNNFSMGGESGINSIISSSYGIGMGSTIANELQILQSRTLSMEIADSLLQKRRMQNGQRFPILYRSYPGDSTLAPKDAVVGRLQNGLTFGRADQQSDVITISYESPSPHEAAAIVNLTMELYTEFSTRQNRRSANSAVAFLENERERIEERLNEVENRLRAFMNDKQLVQVDAQTQQLINRMADLESKKQEARVKLVAVRSGIQQYKDRLNDIKPGLAEQYADAVGPNMMRLQYQLAELEIEKTQLLANNPSLKNSATPPEELKKINGKIEVYRDKIRELTKNLVAEGDEYLGFLGGSEGNIAQAVTELNKKLIELQVEREQYSAQVEVINEQLAQQREFFENLPDNMIELARLKRDVTINEELYLTVSQQYAEMSLWKQTQFGLGRQVDSGYIPESPVKPDKLLYLLIGFLVGGVLSVSYIFAREAFNTKIDGVQKLKDLDVPLLSVVPEISTFVKEEFAGQQTAEVQGRQVSSYLVSMLDTISPISEAFRRLQSNIIYSNPDREINSLMITSSTKGEGKTTVTSNLGVVLAEAGYKVLVVDTDLRRPKLHELFGLQRSPGITEVLFEDSTLEEAMQSTPMEGLSLLAAGKRPPNPSAITQSRAFLETVKGLEESYDFVLIDTPPYGIITDASALISRTDGVVVVTRFNETTEAELSHIFNNLERVNAHVIGTVLTAFDYTQTTDYYYSTHYYREMYEDYATYHRGTGDG